MRTKKKIVSCLNLAALLATPVAMASDPTLRDPGDSLYREQLERERARALERSPEIVPLPLAPPATMYPEEVGEPGPVFLIDAIRLAGDDLLGAERVAQLVAPFLGKALGIHRINMLIDRFNRELVESGYITSRAYIGPQNLNEGALTVTVVAGRIEAIQYNGTSVGKQAGDAVGLRLAAPMDTGEILYLPDIEQTVDQLNRSRRNHVQVSIAPGSQAGGSIVAFVNRQDNAFDYQLAADNQGSEGTGTLRLHASIDAGDLFGWMDNLSLALTTSQETNALNTTLTVPLGYWTVSLMGAWSEYQNLIGDTALVYGTSESASLACNRILHRDADSKTALDFLLTRRQSERSVNNARLTPQVLGVARLGINRLARFASAHGIGQWTLDAGVNLGLDAFGASRDPADLPDEAARAQFRKLDFGASVDLPLSARWTWRGRLVGQWTEDALYSSEQIFAGGVGSVRGFPESAQGGDRGFYLRNEFATWRQTRLFGESLRLEPYLFLDAGQLRTLADGRDQTLVGAGAGIRIGFRSGHAELILGRPLREPDGLEHTGPRLNASIAYRF